MAESGGMRGVAASAVGWLIVLLIAWVVLRGLFGVIGWAFRGLLLLVALVFLINLYFRLKARD